MEFKRVLLFAALAVSLTLGAILLARSSQPLLAGGAGGGVVNGSSEMSQSSQPTAPVLAGGAAGGVVNKEALAGGCGSRGGDCRSSQSIPVSRDGTDRGE